MSIFNRRSRVLVEMNCACPQPASPVADPAVKKQFVPLVFDSARSRSLRTIGCAKCGTRIKLTPLTRKEARDV